MEKLSIDDYWKLAEYDFKCLSDDLSKLEKEDKYKLPYSRNNSAIAYFNKHLKENLNDCLNTLLEVVKSKDEFEKDRSYFKFWEAWKKKGGYDPDDSNSNKPNPFMRTIYYLLWGKKIEAEGEIDGKGICKNGWGNFRTSYLTEFSKEDKHLPWGSDGMNTIGTYTDKIESYKQECESEPEPDKLKDFNNSINDFAESTHQLGNFVLVPAYFNQWKGVRGDIQECFDRGLLELKQKNVCENYEKNNECVEKCNIT